MNSPPFKKAKTQLAMLPPPPIEPKKLKIDAFARIHAVMRLHVASRVASFMRCQAEIATFLMSLRLLDGKVPMVLSSNVDWRLRDMATLHAFSERFPGAFAQVMSYNGVQKKKQYRTEHLDLTVCEEIDLEAETDTCNFFDLVKAGCFPYLRSIKLSGCWIDQRLSLLTTCIPGLTSVSLSFTEFSESLGKKTFADFFQQGEELLELDLAVCGKDQIDNDVIGIIAAHGRLEKLSLCCCGSVDERAVLAIAQKCPLQHLFLGSGSLRFQTSVAFRNTFASIFRASRETLTSLHIRGYGKFCDQHVEEDILAICGQQLTSLNLNLSKNLTSRAFNAIAELCPNLRSLNLGATQIVDNDAEKIIRKCTHLEAFEIAQCDNLSLQFLEKHKVFQTEGNRGQFLKYRPGKPYPPLRCNY